MKRQKSIKTAVLKTLGGQYSALYDMHVQTHELNSQFDSEVHDILHLVLKKIDLDKPAGAKNNSSKANESNRSTAIDIHAENQPNEDFNCGGTKADDLPDEKKKEHPWLRRLFKRIAMHCHPDKISTSNHKKSLLYIKARKALDEDNEPLMLAIGIELSELPDLSHFKIKEILKNESQHLNTKITELHKSPVWLWGMSEDNLEIKATILIHAMAQFYNISVTKKNVMPVLRQYFDYNQNGSEYRKVGTRPKKMVRKK